MDRLTHKSPETDMVWFVDHESNDMLLEPCEMNSHHSRLAIQKLEKYESVEEQGLLVKLPCKVGMRIWVNGILGVGKVEEYEVIRIDYCSTLGTGKNEFYIEALLVKNPKNSIGFYDKEFDKNVFLTKDEAEKSLVESVI